MSSNSQLKSSLLKCLMSCNKNKEVECQEFLVNASPLLIPPMARHIQIIKEQISSVGRSDYFIICEVHETILRKKLIIWEAKAPQVAPFDISTNNRLIPSKPLIEAENQLLYYYDDYRNNVSFLDRYDIRHRDDVLFGGIAIGTDENLIRKSSKHEFTPVYTQGLVSNAIRIRDEHFYKGKIRLITWSSVLRTIESIENKKI